MPNKNDLVTLAITDLTDEGSGVGHAEGFTLFVPGTAVGDQLRARVVKVQKSYGYAIVEEILGPSPNRVEPDCPVYLPCGGCSLRHISYAAELAVKQNWVEQRLRRIGGITAPVLPILGSPQQEGYRNKTQCPVRAQEGGVRVGLFGKRSHRVIPCTDCRLQPPHFAAVLQAVQSFCERLQIPVYEEESHSGLLRHLYLRYAEATGQTMVCLVINGESFPQAPRLIEELQAACPSMVSLMLNHNCVRTNVILGERCTTLWGRDTITDVLCGLQFELSPLSFYQVNRQGAQLLYEAAAKFAGLTGQELLLDLYCGAGAIGLSMAKHARALCGVEIVPEAVEDARRNASRNGITNARFLCDDAAGAARTLRDEGLSPDVVVLDPPRKGCEPAVLQIVAEMNPARIVMISCNSATLARDLAELAALGYRTVKAQPVDLFPRTTHVECVCLLERKGVKPDEKEAVDC